MSEEAIIQRLRKRKDQTRKELSKSSYCVWDAKDVKASEYWDFLCSDFSGFRYVRVFVDYIPREILEKLLSFDYSPQFATPITEIQLYIWAKHGQSPMACPKLKFNCPDQPLPPILQKHVK